MKKQTFCSRLWNEVFINKNGGVFACCHKKPKAIGNIYQNKLRDICNNLIMQNLRLESLAGNLACYKNCTLLRKDRDIVPRDNLQFDYSALKRLKISFSDACNIKCIMCRRSLNDKTCLDFETIKRQIDLSPFESIEIQGGEPLFIEPAKKFFDYVSSLNKKTSFLTNGILINDEWAEKIALHSSFIYFSLNAATKETHEFINKGSRWELVLENIQRVRSARNLLDTSVKIIGNMTVVINNLEEIPLFIGRSSQMGFDLVNFIYDAPVPFYLRCHPFKTRKLRLKIKEAIRSSVAPSLIIDYQLKLLGLA